MRRGDGASQALPLPGNSAAAACARLEPIQQAVVVCGTTPCPCRVAPQRPAAASRDLANVPASLAATTGSHLVLSTLTLPRRALRPVAGADGSMLSATCGLR